MRYFISALLVTACFTALAHSQEIDCRATLSNNLLRLENNRIKRTFAFNAGNLKPLAVTNKSTGHVWQANQGGKGQEMFRLPGNVQSTEGRLEVETFHGDSVQPPHLIANVYSRYETLDLWRRFRVYPDCPVIACDYFIKGTAPESWTPTEPSIAVLRDNERLKTEPFEHNDYVYIDAIAFPRGHAQFHAVEFFDATDEKNTLVRDERVPGFNSPQYLRGNLLFVEDMLNSESLMVLKESPGAFAQLAYPGFDFCCRMDQIQVAGIGIQPDEVTDEWTRCYGVAVGVSSANPTEQRIVLRGYQKRLRTHDPNRDEMLQANTWGDRNRGDRLSTEFCLKEIEACHRLGLTHFQMDAGWTNEWLDAEKPGYYQPHDRKFPDGFTSLVRRADDLGITLGVWTSPGKQNFPYEHWPQFVEALTSLHKQYGISNFKYDLVMVENQETQRNIRRTFDALQKAAGNTAVLNMDITADKRYGYHTMSEYGNLFLENRYSDWGKYYPHWTLRNLWMLSEYVPPERLLVEFLNKWRNPGKYPAGDPLAPANVPFDYIFATTMMGQPLAWFEVQNLPEEAFEIAPMVKQYQQLQHDIHSGVILPIGEEPSGFGWTGFQSIHDNRGYLLVFREYNEQMAHSLSTRFREGERVKLKHLLGHGDDFAATAGQGGQIKFSLPRRFSFALYAYTVEP